MQADDPAFFNFSTPPPVQHAKCVVVRYRFASECWTIIDHISCQVEDLCERSYSVNQVSEVFFFHRPPPLR